MSDVVPVALFAYRRPDLLARVLAALERNHVPLVYAWSDGPRDAGVAADVRAVRDLLRGVRWTDLRLVEHAENVGVNVAMPAGITDVLTRHDAVVVIEDDLELAPGAYAWLCAALARYRDEHRAMCVGAWAHPRITPPGVTGPYFSPRADTWAWGTWRRVWDQMHESTARELRDRCEARGIDVTRCGRDIRDGADIEDGRGAWDYKLNLLMFLRDGLSLFPPVAMASHLGNDARSTHVKQGHHWDGDSAPAPPPGTVGWPPVREHPASAALWRLAVDGPPATLLGRVRRRLARLLSPAR